MDRGDVADDDAPLTGDRQRGERLPLDPENFKKLVTFNFDPGPVTVATPGPIGKIPMKTLESKAPPPF